MGWASLERKLVILLLPLAILLGEAMLELLAMARVFLTVGMATQTEKVAMAMDVLLLVIDYWDLEVCVLLSQMCVVPL